MSHKLEDILKAVHRTGGNALVVINKGEVTQVLKMNTEYNFLDLGEGRELGAPVALKDLVVRTLP